MRLIDADELKKKAVPHIRGTYGGYSARIEDWAVLISDINQTPTINPESLPIVKQLQKEIEDRENCSIEQHNVIHQYRDDLREIKKDLEMVIKERNAVIEYLHGYCPACIHYKISHGKVSCEMCKNKCTQCQDNCERDNWEWIGPHLLNTIK